MEVWKDVVGFESKYKVSNLGKVFSSYLGRELVLHINRDGYVYCRLSIKKNKSKYQTIHRLVALHFIPNPENKPQVNHIDGNKRNNHIDNLEWVTAKENIAHAYSQDLRNNDTIINNGKINAKRVYQINIETDEIIKIWESAKEAEREGGYSHECIGRCCNLQNISHRGFKWRYDETLLTVREKPKVSYYRVEIYQDDIKTKEFSSVEEVAEFYNVNKNTVYRAISENRKFLRKYTIVKINNI